VAGVDLLLLIPNNINLAVAILIATANDAVVAKIVPPVERESSGWSGREKMRERRAVVCEVGSTHHHHRA
jgi:hypothetical protein|tara:strand:+ start:563 stop:772 length:210 start_codon:yes stop_codon:yes gene_type:complete